MTAKQTFRRVHCIVLCISAFGLISAAQALPVRLVEPMPEPTAAAAALSMPAAPVNDSWTPAPILVAPTCTTCNRGGPPTVVDRSPSRQASSAPLASDSAVEGRAQWIAPLLTRRPHPLGSFTGEERLADAINPQPLPPRRGEVKVAVNPQPLPPVHDDGRSGHVA